MEIALLAGIATPLFFSFLISLMSSKRTELFFPISVLGSTIPIATSVYLLMFGKIEGSFNNVLEIAWISSEILSCCVQNEFTISIRLGSPLAHDLHVAKT